MSYEKRMHKNKNATSEQISIHCARCYVLSSKTKLSFGRKADVVIFCIDIENLHCRGFFNEKTRKEKQDHGNYSNKDYIYFRHTNVLTRLVLTSYAKGESD